MFLTLLKPQLSSTSRRLGSAKLVALTLLALALVGCFLVVSWNYQRTMRVAETQATAERQALKPTQQSAHPKPKTTAETGDAHGSEISSKRASTATISLPVIPVAIETQALEQEAVDVVQLLIDRYPARAEPLHVMALLRAQLRQSKEAEELWTKCISLAPDDDRYSINLASLAIDRGDSNLAIEVLNKVASRGPLSHEARHHMALALFNVGKGAEAENFAQALVDDYPTAAAYWLILGQAQLQQGKAAEAEKSLRQAIELGGTSATAAFNLANALARQRKSEDAAHYREIYQQLQQQREIDPDQRFDVLTDEEMRRNAVAVLNECGVLYAQSNEILSAEQVFLRSLALEPRNLVALEFMADMYAQIGANENERVVRARILESSPSSVSAYLKLAKSQERCNEPEQAIATLKLAIALFPDYIEGYAALTQLSLANDKALQAEWFAREAVRRSPSADGYQFLAATLQSVGKKAEAEEAQTQANQLQRVQPKN